jgi:selenide,water dikinase
MQIVDTRGQQCPAPLIGDVLSLTDQGCIPGAYFWNLDFADNDTFFDPEMDYNYKMLAFDAQTSGGILMSVPQSLRKKVIKELKDSGLMQSSIIGYVTARGNRFLCLNN